MRVLSAILGGLLWLQHGALMAQTSGVPPVDACKPGDFTVMGSPDEFGPKRDRRFRVVIDERFNGSFLTTRPVWMPVIEQAVPKWNGIAGADFEFELLGLTDQEVSLTDDFLTIAACGILFSCPTEPPPSVPPGPEPPDFVEPMTAANQTVIAVTLLTSEGAIDRSIGTADIIFNPTLPLSTEPAGNQIDFESVLLHELGHALGLDHNDNCVVGPTVMESVIDLGERRRSLLPPEIAGVQFLYPDESSPAVVVFEKDRSLRFNAVEGGLPPFEQTISVFGARAGSWQATAATSDGGDWLVLNPSSGRFPFTTTIEAGVDASNLSPGDFSATISVNVEGHPGPPAVIEVALHVAEAAQLDKRPLLTRQGIVNAANMASGDLSPGALFTLFGQFLATSSEEAASAPLPTRLAGTEVLVNAVPAPLLFVSPTQINGQVPVDVSPGRGGIIVRTGIGQTPSIPVDLTAAAPELFIVEGDQALALNPDNSVNSMQNPAPQGSFVSVFLSGQGLVSPPVASGRAAAVSPLSRVVLFSSATVGEQPANMPFLGLAPGFVGLAQANIELPASLSGRLPVQITIGEHSSNVGFIYVQ